MTDVIVGRIKGEVLFVRDADDDGVFDEGERIGMRGPGDRFEESRVQDALGRAAIAGFRAGARLQRIGTYIDYINEADRRLGEGDFMAARQQLERAEEFAAADGIAIDSSRFAELRWRAVDAAQEAGAPGITDLNAKDLEILRRDDDADASRRSAGLVLDYLLARSSLENVEHSAGPGRSRLLEALRSSATTLETDIAARARRVDLILHSDSRLTVAEQANEAGTTFRVGDRVRYRDSDSGESWGAAFLITGFEIRTGGVIARGAEVPSQTSSSDPHTVNIDCLEIVPAAAVESAGPESPPVEGPSDWDRLISGLRDGARRLIGLMHF